ncbi:exported hypothetical protein [Xanthomonas citri pv. fuscans]|nr:exported hypothetical protein [Xanthomonas citri pv. fuscans]SOO33026.1 exported hypothetical protein [Xanthomonas citri pv. fuscans]
MSTPLATLLASSPSCRLPIAAACSTTSRPRNTSPSASARVLPCSALSSAASSGMFSRISCWYLRKIRARAPTGVLRQVAKARLAAATAASTSAVVANGTWANTDWSAGLTTSCHCVLADTTNSPSINRETRGTDSLIAGLASEEGHRAVAAISSHCLHRYLPFPARDCLIALSWRHNLANLANVSVARSPPPPARATPAAAAPAPWPDPGRTGAPARTVAKLSQSDRTQSASAHTRHPAAAQDRAGRPGRPAGPGRPGRAGRAAGRIATQPGPYAVAGRAARADRQSAAGGPGAAGSAPRPSTSARAQRGAGTADWGRARRDAIALARRAGARLLQPRAQLSARTGRARRSALRRTWVDPGKSSAAAAPTAGRASRPAGAGRPRAASRQAQLGWAGARAVAAGAPAAGPAGVPDGGAACIAGMRAAAGRAHCRCRFRGRRAHRALADWPVELFRRRAGDAVQRVPAQRTDLALRHRMVGRPLRRWLRSGVSPAQHLAATRGSRFADLLHAGGPRRQCVQASLGHRFPFLACRRRLPAVDRVRGVQPARPHPHPDRAHARRPPLFLAGPPGQQRPARLWSPAQDVCPGHGLRPAPRRSTGVCARLGSERGGRCGTDRPRLPDMRTQRLRAARIPCAATPARARALAAWWEWNLIVGSGRALARDRTDRHTAPGLIASTNLALLPRAQAATSWGNPVGPSHPSTRQCHSRCAASPPSLPEEQADASAAAQHSKPR